MFDESLRYVRRAHLHGVYILGPVQGSGALIVEQVDVDALIEQVLHDRSDAEVGGRVQCCAAVDAPVGGEEGCQVHEIVY